MGQLVVFKLNKESFALPVQYVREITRLGKITPSPQSSGLVKGMINLRDQALPVLDLHKRLGIAPSHCQVALIAEYEGILIGLAVNEVEEVSDFGIVQVPPQAVAAPCIAGIINQPDRLVVVLNIASVVGEDEKVHKSLVDDEFARTLCS